MHLHTLLEERERLCEVADAEVVLGLLSCARVRHLEEEPLLVTFGVRVYFAVQIVSLQEWLSCLATLLYVVCADVLGFSSVKITRLEHRVEYKLLTSQTLPFPEHAYIVSQLLGLCFRRLYLSCLKLVPYCLRDQFVFKHALHIFEHNVEHVFTQLVSVLRRVRLKYQLIERFNV